MRRRSVFALILLLSLLLEASGNLDNVDLESEKCYDYGVCQKTTKLNYFSDLMENLEKRAWEPDQLTCKQKVLDIVRNVQNFTLWAVWIWDSMPSSPVGNMMGSKYHLGNYDQCLMKTPWSEKIPEIRTKYCLTKITLKRNKTEDESEEYIRGSIQSTDPFDKADNFLHSQTLVENYKNMNELFWSVCLPRECSESSIEKFARTLLETSYLAYIDSSTTIDITTVKCQTEKNALTHKLIALMTLLAGLFTVALISSQIYDGNYFCNNIGHKIAKCFSLSKNFNILLEPQEGSLDSINGIRFLSSGFIVVAHIALCFLNSAFNSLDIEQEMQEGAGFLRFDLAVDTFYVLSGLLLMRSLITKSPDSITDLFVQVLKRYIRLVPLLLLMTLYQLACDGMADGPLLSPLLQNENDHCRKNWWTNLLMIGNVYDTKHMCFPVGWYVSSDFQMFLFTLLLFYLYKKGYIGNAPVILVAIIAFLMPGIISYWSNMRLDLPHRLSDVLTRDYAYFINMYIPTYTRAGAYIVGLLTGYFMTRFKLPDHLGMISKNQSIFGVLVSLGLIGMIQLGSKYYVLRKYDMVEELLFETLHRPLFALAVVILIVTCTYGDVPIIKNFLSSRLFVPLSKLSYGIYLFHLLIVEMVLMIGRSPLYMDYFTVLIITLGVIPLACAGSLIHYLLVEVPISNIFEELVFPQLKKNKVRENNNQEDTTNLAVKRKTSSDDIQKRTLVKKVIL